MIKDHIAALDFWNAEKAKKDNQNDSEGGDDDDEEEGEEGEGIIQLDHIKFIAPQKACSFRDFEKSDLIKDDSTLCALRRKIVQHLRQFFEDNSVPHNAFPAIKPDEMVWSASLIITLLKYIFSLLNIMA
jgi:hypothetical protein